MITCSIALIIIPLLVYFKDQKNNDSENIRISDPSLLDIKNLSDIHSNRQLRQISDIETIKFKKENNNN